MSRPVQHLRRSDFEAEDRRMHLYVLNADACSIVVLHYGTEDAMLIGICRCDVLSAILFVIGVKRLAFNPSPSYSKLIESGVGVRRE